MGEEVTEQSIEVDGEGFVRGFEYGLRLYWEMAHPPLSYSLAKSVLQCPEDAYRITQRVRVEREVTDAMDDGNILDSLLTATTPWEQTACPIQQWTAETKKPTDPVEYSDWNGLRILSCETLQTKAAKECAADARRNDLVPVLSHKFVKEVERANEMLIRMELAGFDRSQYRYQVGLYWTEDAANGMRVQCRGRLDFLAHDWSSIVDLKRVDDLSHRALERSVDRYYWAMQAAAYSRAVVLLTAAGLGAPPMPGLVGGVPAWRWLFARTAPVVACTLRPAGATLLQAGEAAWNRAVNEWADGLATGLWRGHESDHTPLEPTRWAEAQMEADLV
jgi:hypothetical protein